MSESHNQNRFKSLVFVFGILAASATAIALDGVQNSLSAAFTNQPNFADTDANLADFRDFEHVDQTAAQTAWTYIENNTIAETGWVNSVEGFDSSTLWDQGSYVFALVAAARIGVIGDAEFDTRISSFLDGLQRLELIDGALPNKVYNTRSLRMTDYSDASMPDGIGWSALDIARLLMSLRTVERFAPHHAAPIRDVLSDWDFDRMTQDGQLIGTAADDGALLPVQEGRIGYEQYGARAAALWGMDVNQAISALRVLGWRNIEDVEVPVDLRTAARFGTITPVLSEPYLLMALEMGFDDESEFLADRIYTAQKARFRNTGQVTFVSEDHLDTKPHFVYASIFSNGKPWSVVDIEGENYPELRTQSAKATFGWDALYNTEYTNLGLDRIQHLAIKGRGWMAGVYEATGKRNTSLSLNTNAVILEALHYKRFGPLWNTAKPVASIFVAPETSQRPKSRSSG